MSLATRCSQCGTVFRVVQDQLKVSEGWVRCGRCNEVFNALQGLFDLERDTPPDWSPSGFGNSSTPPDDGPIEPASEALASADAPDEPSMPPAASETAPEAVPAAPVGSGPAADAWAPATGGAPSDGDDSDPVALPPPRDDEAPAFVRHADRRARWRSPHARLALSGGALMLALALSVQVIHHFRGVAAARWTSTAPLLQQWCSLASCVIETPRRIEDVFVESSSLIEAGASDTYRLALSVRNKAPVPVAMPSLDLNLTDGSGATVARRAIDAKDLRTGAPTIPAAGEAQLNLTVAVAGGRVSGYTVELFYP